MDASDIEAQVANGEVTLAGAAEERRQKRLAEDLAEDVPGVRDVHNRIKGRGGEGFIDKVKEALNPNAGTDETRAGVTGAATGTTPTAATTTTGTNAATTGTSGRGRPAPAMSTTSPQMG